MDKKIIKHTNYEKHLDEQMKDKEFRKAFEEESQRLKIAYQILHLRKKNKISQQKLAKKLETTQSVVARMEAGQQNFTTDTLQKIASAFGRNLKIDFIK